jgi:hypothetical protein
MTLETNAAKRRGQNPNQQPIVPFNWTPSALVAAKPLVRLDLSLIHFGFGQQVLG